MPRSPHRHARRSVAAVVATLAGIAVAAVAIMGTAADGRSTQRSKPSLTLTHVDPVRISGHHFAARKSVRVRLVASMTRSRTLKTNSTGAFTVTFAAVIDRCSSWSVIATQQHRSAVVLRSPAKPLCPPASTP